MTKNIHNDFRIFLNILEITYNLEYLQKSKNK